MTKRDERGGMHFVSDLGNAMRRNPVSTALIGMGLLWLFTGDRARAGVAQVARKTGLDRMPDAAAEAFDRVGERFADVGDKLSDVRDSAATAAGDMARTVRDRGADALDRAGEFGRAIPETGADLFSEARDRLSTLFNEQPLMLGAVGIAIGAGIAASLPSTEVEAELFGDTSDELKSQARGFAHRATERAGMVARDVAGAAAEEARRQGLTPEAAMGAARDVGAKAKRVAEVAEDNVRLE
jgi:ElaB/YqjD/DUF883 family membrane-anchored ribosome-binding protein